MNFSLLGLVYENLLSEFQERGFSKLDAKRVYLWIHKKNLSDFNEMTDLKKETRESLKAHYSLARPECLSFQESKDGTRKALLKLDDLSRIETVLIPDNMRMTICISSQVGCAMKCKFCNTGTQGFSRNLTAAEIIGQVLFWSDYLETELLNFLSVEPLPENSVASANGRRNIFDDILNDYVDEASNFSLAIRRFNEIKKNAGGELLKAQKLVLEEKPAKLITNIVFMGMGEPLLNSKNLFDSLELLLDERTYNFSHNKITVSTCGIVSDALWELAKYKVRLAVSLHAADDSLRSKIMPINQKYPLRTVVEAALKYQKISKTSHVTFEYLILGGVNDSKKNVSELVMLLRNKPARVNLIMFNPWTGCPFKNSDEKRANEIAKILISKNIRTIIRKSKGQDILAACGQLKTQES